MWMINQTNFLGKMACEMGNVFCLQPHGINGTKGKLQKLKPQANILLLLVSHIAGRPMSILMSRKGYPGFNRNSYP
jgi:methylenetetrahydrofolate dehydrogenase (NADP+)/methenyltetrahydrofolate cyclohydrolase